MIVDHLKNAGVYRALSERFAAGFDYLQRTDFSKLPDGRYDIAGDDVYAMVQSYESKPESHGRWEAHRLNADIQYVIAGREKMGIAPVTRMRTQVAYDEEKDVEFFSGEGEFVTIETGTFAVFLPQDVHMPMLAVDRPGWVKKVVVKIRVG